MTGTPDPDSAAATALRLLGPDPQDWVPERPGIDHSVAVVGGGQTGCALAFALRRAGVGRVTVIDAADDEDSAGIWLTAARMQLLRTPKSLPGPEQGIPALGFQAWYEARHGQAAYAAIDRIPRLLWAEYLAWYRHFLKIPVRYRTRLQRIEPLDDGFRLHLLIDGRPATETARKIVLATGFTGNGGAYTPPALAGLPPSVLAHTQDAIDFAALRGRTVAVVGAAASAFDAAGVALEHGAAAVHLFARRPSLAALPIARTRLYPGAYDHYRHVPDAIRWHQAVRFRRFGSTPTIDAIERTVAFRNFHLHLAAPWHDARLDDGVVVAEAADGRFRFDFVIAGTGYFVDPAARPEIADFADRVLLWRDRYVPPAEERDEFLGSHPYLGEGHEYLEKVPGSAPFLRDIHVHNPAGFVSFGLPIGDVPSMRRDIPLVAGRISRDLFLADLSHHERRMDGMVAPDFPEEVYASAVWKG
ncbi:NAD(P)-binding domain-containing protein [Rhodopila globiformis]|uniref:Monooxygenase n=1 Tax=Rhodopila globiformis TaxID=1071 RepID=A0A2S6N6C0_RHOGL|nr:NAD(P)-binding domain-containing protein [Rhodopila globiformis]PPQ30166.1 monooxygenase [Rhodopila globiformis]